MSQAREIAAQVSRRQTNRGRGGRRRGDADRPCGRHRGPRPPARFRPPRPGREPRSRPARARRSSAQAQEYAIKQLRSYGDVIARKWLLFLVAIALVLAASVLAPVGRSSEIILTPFTGNILLRSVLGSVIAVLIVIGGILAALHLLGMTEAVVLFLGLAGVVTLAVGFAFRDFAENFIASVTLGVEAVPGGRLHRGRRQGRRGPLAEHAHTVLVTLDGSDVRIPNAMIFKEIVQSETASTACGAALTWWCRGMHRSRRPPRPSPGRSARTKPSRTPPPPRSWKRLNRAASAPAHYFWCPARGVDRLKLQSDALLSAKVALQKAGIAPAPARMVVTVAGDAQLTCPARRRPGKRAVTRSGDRGRAGAG